MKITPNWASIRICNFFYPQIKFRFYYFAYLSDKNGERTAEGGQDMAAGILDHVRSEKVLSKNMRKLEEEKIIFGVKGYGSGSL